MLQALTNYACLQALVNVTGRLLALQVLVNKALTWQM